MTWQTVAVAWTAWATGDYYAGILRAPLWPTKAAVAFGIGLLTLRLLTDLVYGLLRVIGQWRPRPALVRQQMARAT